MNALDPYTQMWNLYQKVNKWKTQAKGTVSMCHRLRSPEAKRDVVGENSPSGRVGVG